MQARPILIQAQATLISLPWRRGRTSDDRCGGTCHVQHLPLPLPVSRFPGRVLTEAVVLLMTLRVY